MPNRIKQFGFAVCAAFLAFGAATAAPAVTEPGTSGRFDFGADFRVRWDSYNNMGGRDAFGQCVEKDYDHYLRFRTRLWGSWTYDRFMAHVRLANEFRHYFRGASEGTRHFPDETCFDSLYFRMNDVFDGCDLIVGRQDLASAGFASKRILDDGTAGDGTRTDFYDAVRVLIHADEKRTLNLIGLYCTNDDWLPVAGHRHGSEHSEPNRRSHYDYTNLNHHEWGLMAYYTDRSSKALGWDAYLIGKQEESSKSLRLASHNRITGKDRHHYNMLVGGFRLLPKFTEEWSGELELAMQAGDDSLLAGMGFASVAFAPAGIRWSPSFSANLFATTGSTDGPDGNHAWHAVFCRSAVLGDHVVNLTSCSGTMTNLIYPYLEASVKPCDGLNTRLSCGPMFTARRVGRGEDKSGSYYGISTRFALNVFPGELTGIGLLSRTRFTFLAEWLAKGNYLDDGYDDDILYLRAETVKTF